jgi:hypothetical protein
MFALRTHLLLALRSVIEARASREAKILVLRQQLAMLNRKSPARLRPRNIGRLIRPLHRGIFSPALSLFGAYRGYATVSRSAPKTATTRQLRYFVGEIIEPMIVAALVQVAAFSLQGLTVHLAQLVAFRLEPNAGHPETVATQLLNQRRPRTLVLYCWRPSASSSITMVNAASKEPA